MSAPVTTPAATAPVPTARVGGSGSPDATPGTRTLRPTVGSALVVLVSVVLSVAASTSVVAFSGVGTDATPPAPAAEVRPDRGAGAAEDGAVERGAADVVDQGALNRFYSLCPPSDYPAAAC